VPGSDLDDYIAAAAQALDLTLETAWQPAVRANLESILWLASYVQEFPLPDEAEPDAVFRA
jgi:hypothetical protein